MWWWLNRGYTPAGVEAWNCVRALDYLETRPEVDKTRFGVTGRSGGGAYSWWIAAIDERIKVAVPTAGITDMQNHVVDGCVEGHCDCMFMVNTYRWDYPQVAALVAPRPLLISNTDNDRIFPLDGVVRTFDKVRRIYRLYDKEKKGTGEDVALNISPGPHKDTQELNTHEFRWFNHYLKGDDSPIDSRAPKYFQPEELKVFVKLPEDQINTKVHETFVGKAAVPAVPQDTATWKTMREQALDQLKAKAFRGWPDGKVKDEDGPSSDGVKDGVMLLNLEFVSHGSVRLKMFVALSETLMDQLFRKQGKADLVVLNVLDDSRWREFLGTARPGFADVLKGEALPPADAKAYESWTKMLKNNRWVMAYVAPGGVGPTVFEQTERKQIQNRRRFYLLGQTLDSQQVWDVRRAIQLIQEDEDLFNHAPLWLQSHGSMGGVALYASLFEPSVKRLDLYDLPRSQRDGPIFLNVERYLDMPQAVAMAAERSKVVLYQDDDSGWEYPQAVAKALNWDAKQIQIRRKPVEK